MTRSSVDLLYCSGVSRRLWAERAPASPKRITVAATATCDLVVNGASIRRVELSEQWKTVRVEVSSQIWRAGPNEIDLKWAVRLGEIGQAKDQAVRALEAGIFPDLMLAYGEVFAFTAHRSQ